MSIWLYEPDFAVFVVSKKFPIVFRRHFSSPNHPGLIDVCGVVNPFILRIVIGRIANDRDLEAGKSFELIFDALAIPTEDVGAVPAAVPGR